MSEPTDPKPKVERRRRKVIAIFSDPTNAPTIQAAATILGVSAKTIERDLKAVRGDMAEAEDKLQTYQRQFKERLPIDERVRLYEEIARQDGNLFARFKALQRIDAIDGIISDMDRLKVEGRHEQPRQPVPMFQLPPGAKISVVVAQNITQNTTIDDRKGTVAELDITPQADTGNND